MRVLKMCLLHSDVHNKFSLPSFMQTHCLLSSAVMMQQKSRCLQGFWNAQLKFTLILGSFKKQLRPEQGELNDTAGQPPPIHPDCYANDVLWVVRLRGITHASAMVWEQILSFRHVFGGFLINCLRRFSRVCIQFTVTFFFFSSHFHSLICSHISDSGSDIDSGFRNSCQTIYPELQRQQLVLPCS